ncbi:MAG TPA: enoyl-CoA hydratase/isomerase family protein [Pseudolysinimonas sp.]|nr:enoyl-CoA hydratase/isomerase family protein [Pseudolysinimonas sp.]
MGTHDSEPEDFVGLRSRVGGFVEPSNLDEYAQKYRDHVVLTRDDGVLTFRIHHDDGPAVMGFPARNAWLRAMREVAADRENEVVVFTGTGDRWLGQLNPASYARLNDSRPEVLYEHHYRETQRLLEVLLNDFEVPTIAALNGPADGFTFALMTDLVIASDTAVVTDTHFAVGAPPGDGLALVLQGLMGPRRAAAAVYLCEELDAATMLQLGIVNEVVPHSQVLSRALDVAAELMRAPETTRRATHSIVSRPLRHLFARDQEAHLAQEMYALQLEMQAGTQQMHRRQQAAAERNGATS